MSSIAWLMGKKQAHHCEQHGGLFRQKSVTAKMGSNPSLRQISVFLVLAVGWSGTACIMPTAKRRKVFKTQSNASQSRLFLLMCYFVVKLFQENS